MGFRDLDLAPGMKCLLVRVRGSKDDLEGPAVDFPTPVVRIDKHLTEVCALRRPLRSEEDGRHLAFQHRPGVEQTVTPIWLFEKVKRRPGTFRKVCEMIDDAR